jgi:hypothetical protein
VPTTAKGYEKLLCWVEGFGPVRCAGIEGTSSYGAGVARYLVTISKLSRSTIIAGDPYRKKPQR